MKKQEIENKIAQIKANKAIPESAKATMLKVWETKLEKLNKKESNPQKKTNPSKKRTHIKMVGEKNIKDVPCDELKKKFTERREQAKKSGKKYRTKPVIHKVSSNVITAVHQVIDSVPAGDRNKKVTAQMITFVRKAKEFVTASKALLGSDYSQSKVNADFDELKKFVEKLETKISKKK